MWAMAASRALLCLFALQLLLPARTERYILQSVLDCSKAHPACNSCSVRRTTANGLVSQSDLICKGCLAPKFKLFNDNTTSTCACSPGYYAKAEDLNTCEDCPKNSWCPGGVAAAATKNLCGNCLMTVTTLAQNASACITQAGCGYQPDGSGSVCRIGTYNSGNNQQPCTSCPAGLTTLAAHAETVAACMAPPGYFFQNMQALPCSKGTFKDGVNRATSCTSCPAGITTAGVSSSAFKACDRALPGFRPVFSNTTFVSAEACPVGTYGPDGLRCINCTDGLTTQTTARTTPVDCQAPPGYGYYPDGTGDDSPITTADVQAAGSKVVKCPSGSFKAGWNLDRCKSCGTNVLTDTNASDGLGLSADQCYIAPGWGATFDAEAQQLVAFKCNNGTFGVADRTYGLENRPCKPCPPHTVTPDQFEPEDSSDSAFHTTGSTDVITSMDQCSTMPGYGWEDGVAAPCTIGYWAHGYDNQACIACGEGLTTAQAKSRRTTDCIALPGWEKKNPHNTYAEACPVGSWSRGNQDSCQKCPLGSSTEYTSSYSMSQCSVCSPGWGFDTNSSSCTICTPGSYSPGGSDSPCVSCEPGQTSAEGASSSDDCFNTFTSTMPFDFIETPASAWTVLLVDGGVNSSANAADCREACRTEPRCQYWLFRAGQDDPWKNGCAVKLAPNNYAPDSYTALKLGTGDYTIWQASADEYEMQANGVKPWIQEGAAINPWRCLRGCDKDASCLGLSITKLNGSWACWFVHGGFGLGSTASSIKATPGSINTYYWAWATNATTPLARPTNGAPSNSASNSTNDMDTTVGAPNSVIPDNTSTGAAHEVNTFPSGFSGDAINSLSGSNMTTLNASGSTNGSEVVVPLDVSFVPHSNTGLAGEHTTMAPPNPDMNATQPASSPNPVAAGQANTSAPASSNTAVQPEPTNTTAPNVAAPNSAGNTSAPASSNTAVQPEPSNTTAPNVAAPNAAGNISAPASSNTAVQPEPTNTTAPNVAAPNAAGNTSAPVSNNTAVQPEPTNTTAPNVAAPNAAGNTSAPASNAAVQPEPSNTTAPNVAAPNAAGNTSAPVSNNTAVQPEPTNTTAPNVAAPNAAGNTSAPVSNADVQPEPSNTTAPNVAAPNAAGNTSAPGGSNTAVQPEPSNTTAPNVAASNAAGNTTPSNGTAPNAAGNTTSPANVSAGDAVNQTMNTTASCHGPYRVSTVAGTGIVDGPLGDGGLATQAALNYPIGVSLDSHGQIFIADTLHHRIRVVNASSGRISTFAGTGAAAFGGDDGPPAAASLNMPTSVAFSPAGAVMISDTTNNRLRAVQPAADGSLGGRITTVSGTGAAAYSGDGGAAKAAALYLPMQAVFDSNGNMYIADSFNHVVRVVNASSGKISTVAGTGTAGYSGDGGLATKAELQFPVALAFDQDGQLLIADMNNHAVRRVDASAAIRTIAGTGAAGFSGDGSAATSAQLSSPAGIAVDGEGNVVISDGDNHRLRRVNATTGVITTIAGSTEGFAGDGQGDASAAKFNAPQGIAMRPDGSILVADARNQRVRSLSCF